MHLELDQSDWKEIVLRLVHMLCCSQDKQAGYRANAEALAKKAEEFEAAQYRIELLETKIGVANKALDRIYRHAEWVAKGLEVSPPLEHFVMFVIDDYYRRQKTEQRGQGGDTTTTGDHR